MKNILWVLCSVFLLVITIDFTGAVENMEGKEKNAAADRGGAVNAQALVTKGNRAFAAKRYDEALALYKRAIEIDAGSEDAHYNSAVTYERKGMVDESINSYEKLLAVYPNNAQAHNNLGILYESKEMPIKAFSEFKQAVAKNPNLPEAQYNLGRVYCGEGLMEKAAGHLHTAGLLFIKKGDRKWAEHSYTLLKKTHSEELASDLYERMNKVQ